MKTRRSLLASAIVCAALTVFLPAATAVEISGTIFELEVCQGGVCVAQYDVEYSEEHWNPASGHYFWALAQDIPFESPSGEEIFATLGADGTFVEIVPPGPGRSDPQVNLGFAMIAGDETTTFTVKSAEVVFDTIMYAEGRATASFTVSDGFDDGALLEGLDGPAYLAQYNAFVPGGTTFAQLIPSIAVAPFQGSNGLSQDYPGGGSWETIGVPVDRMSSMISFTITANDMASGTSNFEIMPEPTSLLLLAVGMTLIRRR